MKKIKTGDTVVVLAGKDKGSTGRVLRVIDRKAKVEGINLVKKHKKPNPNKDFPGGIVEQEAFIDVSNLAIMNPQTNNVW